MYVVGVCVHVNVCGGCMCACECVWWVFVCVCVGMYVCLYACVCMCMVSVCVRVNVCGGCMCVHGYACVKHRGQPEVLFLRNLASCSLRQSLSLACTSP